MESATSGQSATSQCLSALPGRLGRGNFVLDGLGWKDKNQRTYYSYTTTAWWLSILRCNYTAVTRGRMEFHPRGGGETGPQGPIPKKKNSNKKIPKEEVDWVEVLSSPTVSRARAMY